MISVSRFFYREKRGEKMTRFTFYILLQWTGEPEDDICG